MPFSEPSKPQFEPLTEARLDEVVAIERSAYDHPWTRGNFADSLRSGYQAQVLGADGVLLGYFVAMKGVDEVHLLNITVAPDHQRQGWGRVMLDALALWARGQGAQWLWLEVRVEQCAGPAHLRAPRLPAGRRAQELLPRRRTAGAKTPS